MPSSALLEFYRGRSRTPQGHDLEEVWAFSAEQLESVHDYIQWLFPTRSPSRFHPLAPILDEATLGQFRQSESLQQAVLRSLEVMLQFFGLALERCEVAPTVREDPQGEARRRLWQSPGNHNLLRLTRMIDSLHSLGLERYALSLYLYLEGAHQRHPERLPYDSLVLWRKAAGLAGEPPRAPGLWERWKAHLGLARTKARGESEPQGGN